MNANVLFFNPEYLEQIQVVFVIVYRDHVSQQDPSILCDCLQGEDLVDAAATGLVPFLFGNCTWCGVLFDLLCRRNFKSINEYSLVVITVLEGLIWKERLGYGNVVVDSIDFIVVLGNVFHRGLLDLIVQRIQQILFVDDYVDDLDVLIEFFCDWTSCLQNIDHIQQQVLVDEGNLYVILIECVIVCGITHLVL